jgi:bis(5'-nucleosyl)-tetraphosphatase (symmetrical)
MAIYAIGDVQGCFDALMRLLREIQFDGERDQLWFVGDLVNRGPQSLETLRFVQGLGDRAVVTLGNHDLHLLAVAEGLVAARGDDTLAEILSAPDRDQLLYWLRRRKLMHSAAGWTMVHAGLLPHWSIPRALQLAGEVEQALRARNYREFLAHMYGNTPDRWDEELSGYPRLRVVVNAMTRLRVCDAEGAMALDFSGDRQSISGGLFAWFEVPERASARQPIVCGHWSALGLHLGADVVAIDSGCLWGRSLTALRLPERQVIQVACSRSGS